jgi:hypothetical protein
MAQGQDENSKVLGNKSKKEEKKDTDISYLTEEDRFTVFINAI